MVNQPIEAVAAVAGRGAIPLNEMQAELPDGSDASKALFRLSQLGLVFRIAQGSYAVPGKEELSDALALRGPPMRLAGWLHRWLQSRENRDHLPSGLDWAQASFVGLSLHIHSQLDWKGPALLVPIDPDADRIEGLHHSVSIFACDPVHTPNSVDLKGVPSLLPDPDDLARVLLVHQDPRIQEAGEHLHAEHGRDEGDFDVHLARTDPPMPFPDSKLARGPPFRYRLFAPRSWVNENLKHAHPARHLREDVGRRAAR